MGSRPLLAEALREAVAQGGPALGRICTQLLETNAGLRIPMADVATQCSAAAVAAVEVEPVAAVATSPPVTTVQSSAAGVGTGPVEVSVPAAPVSASWTSPSS